MNSYREVEKQATGAVRNAKRNFEKKLANEKYKNSKPFHGYLKGRTKCRTTVGPLKDKERNLISSNDGMAEILNEFFAGVFCKEGVGPVLTVEPENCQTRLEDSVITEEKIKEKIRSLTKNSAAGPYLFFFFFQTKFSSYQIKCIFLLIIRKYLKSFIFVKIEFFRI